MAAFLDSLAGARETNPDRVGRVRILLIGNPGSGKTTLAHLLAHGTPPHRVSQTVGCNAFVKLVEYPEEVGADGAVARARQYFVELWDVGAHERYAELRPLFYQQLNGVLLVHDLSSRRSAAGLERWAREVAGAGTFTAPLADEARAGSPGGLPVPTLTVGTKADMPGASQLGARSRSSGLLSRTASASASGGWASFLAPRRQQPAAKKSLLPDFEESAAAAAASQSVITAAAAGRMDAGAFHSFFLQCIQRRYYAATAGQPPPVSPQLRSAFGATPVSRFTGGRSSSGNSAAGLELVGGSPPGYATRLSGDGGTLRVGSMRTPVVGTSDSGGGAGGAEDGSDFI